MTQGTRGRSTTGQACSRPTAEGGAHSLASRLVLAAALYACLGGPVVPRGFAQTLPLPAIPPPLPTPAPSLPAEPAAAAETTATETAPLRQWEYLLGVAGGYDSNVFFVPGGPADSVLSPRAELARTSRGPRGESRLEASTRVVAYLQQQQDVVVDAALSASGRHETSARTTVTGQFSGGLGHTDESVLLTEQGVLLPFSQTRFARADAGVQWQTGARTTLEIRGRAYYDDFVQPELVDSTSLRGSVNLGRRLSDRSELLGEYAIERAKSDASYTTQFGSLQLARRLSSRSGFLVEAGSSYTEHPATSSARPSGWNFYGGASFARQLGPSSTAVFARREVIPTFGIGGLRLTDRVGLRTNSRIGQTWELSAEATYVRRNPTAPDGSDRSDSEEARFALQKRIARRFGLGADVQYRRHSAEAARPRVEQLEAMLTVSLLSPQAGVGLRP